MKLSIYDLVYKYFTDLYPLNKPITDKDKVNIYNIFWSLLKDGWTADEMISHISQAAAKTPGVEPEQGNLLAFFYKLKRNKQNILYPGTVYTHSQLRVFAAAPVIDVDINTGEIKYEQHDYYMEPRASYTIEELISYYNWVVKPIRNNQISRYMSVFNILVKGYGIDHVLYMIDTIVNKMIAGEILEPNTPLVIQDYSR